jgi:hypothetical protein
MQPILAALETTCVSSLRYCNVADRILEHAVLSKHVYQCDVFLIAKNNTCRHNALPAAVTNIRMTTDDGAPDTGCTRDDLCVKFEVLQCS